MNEKSRLAETLTPGAKDCEETLFTRFCAGAGMLLILLLCLAAGALLTGLLSGCAMERADPAARSARATYGAITLVASGAGAKASLTIGDGAFTAADGEGNVTQPSTQTATQNPDLSGAAGGLSPIGAGIAAATQIGGKLIDATKEVKAAKANAEAKKADAAKAQAEAEADAAKAANANCPDCEFVEDCPDCDL